MAWYTRRFCSNDKAASAENLKNHCRSHCYCGTLLLTWRCKNKNSPFYSFTDILLSQDNHVGNFLYIVDSGDLNVDFSFIYCQKYKSYLKLNVLPNWNRIVFQSDKILVPKFHPKPPRQEWRLQLRAQKSLNFLLLGRERPFYLLQWLEMLVMLELIFGFIC